MELGEAAIRRVDFNRPAVPAAALKHRVTDPQLTVRLHTSNLKALHRCRTETIMISTRGGLLGPIT